MENTKQFKSVQKFEKFIEKWCVLVKSEDAEIQNLDEREISAYELVKNSSGYINIHEYAFEKKGYLIRCSSEKEEMVIIRTTILRPAFFSLDSQGDEEEEIYENVFGDRDYFSMFSINREKIIFISDSYCDFSLKLCSDDRQNKIENLWCEIEKKPIIDKSRVMFNDVLLDMKSKSQRDTDETPILPADFDLMCYKPLYAKRIQHYKRVSIFISSSFKDMQEERNQIYRLINEKLIPWGREYGIDLNILDLRWGIAGGESEAKRTIALCLKAVADSVPMVISLVGGRRGWVPRMEDLSEHIRELVENEEKCKKYNFSKPILEAINVIREHIGKNSITEMESLYALQEWGQTNVDFFVRDVDYLGEDDNEQLYQIAMKHGAIKYNARWNVDKCAFEPEESFIIKVENDIKTKLQNFYPENFVQKKTWNDCYFEYNKRKYYMSGYGDSLNGELNNFILNSSDKNLYLDNVMLGNDGGINEIITVYINQILRYSWADLIFSYDEMSSAYFDVEYFSLDIERSDKGLIVMASHIPDIVREHILQKIDNKREVRFISNDRIGNTPIAVHLKLLSKDEKIRIFEKMLQRVGKKIDQYLVELIEMDQQYNNPLRLEELVEGIVDIHDYREVVFAIQSAKSTPLTEKIAQKNYRPAILEKVDAVKMNEYLYEPVGFLQNLNATNERRIRCVQKSMEEQGLATKSECYNLNEIDSAITDYETALLMIELIPWENKEKISQIIEIKRKINLNFVVCKLAKMGIIGDLYHNAREIKKKDELLEEEESLIKEIDQSLMQMSYSDAKYIEEDLLGHLFEDQIINDYSYLGEYKSLDIYERKNLLREGIRSTSTSLFYFTKSYMRENENNRGEYHSIHQMRYIPIRVHRYKDMNVYIRLDDDQKSWMRI